jgi:hypothetical protein
LLYLGFGIKLQIKIEDSNIYLHLQGKHARFPIGFPPFPKTFPTDISCAFSRPKNAKLLVIDKIKLSFIYFPSSLLPILASRNNILHDFHLTTIRVILRICISLRIIVFTSEDCKPDSPADQQLLLLIELESSCMTHLIENE